MTNAELLERAFRAKVILDNPLYQESWKEIRERLIQAMLAVKLEDRDAADDFRRCVKLCDALKSEFDHALNAGIAAQADIDAIEKRRKNPLRGIFR